MPGYTPKLRELLRAGGCTFVRYGRGDHEIWYSPLTDTNFPVDADIRSRHTANKTLKDAGLKKAF